MTQDAPAAPAPDSFSASSERTAKAKTVMLIIPLLLTMTAVVGCSHQSSETPADSTTTNSSAESPPANPTATNDAGLPPGTNSGGMNNSPTN